MTNAIAQTKLILHRLSLPLNHSDAEYTATACLQQLQQQEQRAQKTKE